MKTLTRHCQLTFAALLLSVTAGTVSADWHQFWHQFNVDYHRANAWPDPFNEGDAMQVVAPFEVMKHNGWRMHNTIGNDLFRQGDGALLAAGNNRVHWIATQAPEARRTVYVLRGKSLEETNARVTSVRQTLANVYMAGPIPDVIVTEKEPSTAPGGWAVQIQRDWMEVLPKPKLPQRSAQGNESTAEQ
ncbi:hypothetical protein [Novipirellula artificiosorum]|uniref:Uncharacterized protein n=1 Tax=Novipirellula artificiosorum TaxID=2528016 RepID=A0A5C6DMK4_9BACT|nr:hypothetical protein [Novipirellula artificiosorum]TWU37395.1 hypothetical protein Poly41_35250 [Novipirellula artificiosorum]